MQETSDTPSYTASSIALAFLFFFGLSGGDIGTAAVDNSW